MVEAKETLLLTGITGYVGSQVAKVLFDTYGTRFKLRATVRSLASQSKLDPLRKAFGEEHFSSIEFLEADLLSKEVLSKAIAGSTYIIHVASPIPGARKFFADEMLNTAVKGMQSILQCAVESKVKRLIVTSSIGCVVGADWKRGTADPDYTEKDIAPAEGQDPY